MGDFNMNNDRKGPLMFINSVQSSHSKSFESGQKVFDSRIPKKIVIEEEKKEIILVSEDLKKLFNIITLYHNGTKVLCEFTCYEKVVIGIPIEVNDEILVVLVDGIREEIALNEIKQFIILDF